MAIDKPTSLIAKLKIKKDEGTITKAEEKKLKQLIIAYKPLSEAEKARQRADLIRKLKSGEHTAGYRWHGGRTDFSDRD
jgi:hypothetical protein